MSFSPDRTAAHLLGQRRKPRPLRTPIGRLADELRPSTLAEGVAAQRALATLTDAAAPAGFKIGATGARMQAYLGLDGPVAGFMAQDTVHASGSTLSAAPFLRPGVECELCVHLAHDLPPALTTVEQAAAAVDTLMAAIELVENRYEELGAFGTPSLMADQVYHAGAFIGAPLAEWHGLDLAALRGVMTVDGAVVGEGLGRELLGHPMAALAWLAGSAEAAAFGGLRAGQVIMLGSVCPPVWLEGDTGGRGRIEVRFDGLAEAVLTLV